MLLTFFAPKGLDPALFVCYLSSRETHSPHGRKDYRWLPAYGWQKHPRKLEGVYTDVIFGAKWQY